MSASGEQIPRANCRSVGCFHTKQGAPDVIPANYHSKCHFQEQDLGGAFAGVLADVLVTISPVPHVSI